MLFCFEIIYSYSNDLPLLFFGEEKQKPNKEALLDLESVTVLRYVLCQSIINPPTQIIEEQMKEYGSVKSVRRVRCIFRDLPFHFKLKSFSWMFTLFVRKLLGRDMRAGNFVIFSKSPPLGFQSIDYKEGARMFFDRNYAKKKNI